MALMTRLEAINLMFAAVSEEPVASEADAFQIDNGRATNMLDACVASTCTMGWSFNTSIGEIDASGLFGFDGIKPLLRAEPLDPTIRLALVSGSLVDRATGNQIPGIVMIRGTVLLGWDDLPEPARRYVAHVAKARYANDSITSDSQAKMLDPEVQLHLQVLWRDFAVEPLFYVSSTGDWRVDQLNVMFQELRLQAQQDGTTTPALVQDDTDKALKLLSDSMSFMQSMGWTFNTLMAAPLSPLDAGHRTASVVVDGVDVPTLRIHSYDPQFDVVQVGDRIADRFTGSTAFAGDVTVRAVVERDWDQIPEAARQYVVQMAKARYATDAPVSASQAAQIDPQLKFNLQVLQRDFGVPDPAYDTGQTYIPEWRLSSPQRRYGIGVGYNRR